MKRIISLLIICIITLSCQSKGILENTNRRIEVTQIDSVDIYYIFTLKNNTIVLGEIEDLKPCYPFKKYLIRNSIKQTMYLKEETKKVSVAYLGYINDKKIKNSGEPVKYIDSCEVFSD